MDESKAAHRPAGAPPGVPERLGYQCDVRTGILFGAYAGEEEDRMLARDMPTAAVKEIVRRYNAHDALAARLRALVDAADDLPWPPIEEIEKPFYRALAAARKTLGGMEK